MWNGMAQFGRSGVEGTGLAREGKAREGTEMQVRKGRSVKERRESRGRHGVGAAVGTVLD